MASFVLLGERLFRSCEKSGASPLYVVASNPTPRPTDPLSPLQREGPERVCEQSLYIERLGCDARVGLGKKDGVWVISHAFWFLLGVGFRGSGVTLPEFSMGVLWGGTASGMKPQWKQVLL